MKSIPLSISAFLPISAFLIVSACGSTVTPNYAKPGDVVQAGSSFAQQPAKRFVVVNGDASLRDQTFEVEISSDGQTVYVTQNNKQYTLVSNGSGLYVGDNGTYYRAVTGSDWVETIFFSEQTSGYYNGGHVVIGYQTNPTEVSAQSGTAAYSGQTSLTARTLTQDGFAVGNVTLSADFDTNTVTGLMAITDDGGVGDIFIPTSTITINPTNIPNISGNTFSGVLDITLGATVDTILLDQSGLTGGFYGVDAAAIGATYWATGTLNGDPLFIEGALSSDN